MSEITQKSLFDKYEQDLKELQSSCTHKKTEWMAEYWAPAHSTGNQVEVCERCGFIVNRKLSEIQMFNITSAAEQSDSLPPHGDN